MSYHLPFLPLEIQTSIAELRALGVAESALELLITRTAKALESKTTSLQMDIVRIEDGINLRVDRIGEKLGDDVRLQLGATNEMLVALRTEVSRFHDELAALQHETIQDELDRAERLILTDGLRRVLIRWPEVEELLNERRVEAGR